MPPKGLGPGPYRIFRHNSGRVAVADAAGHLIECRECHIDGPSAVVWSRERQRPYKNHGRPIMWVETMGPLRCRY